MGIGALVGASVKSAGLRGFATGFQQGWGAQLLAGPMPASASWVGGGIMGGGGASRASSQPGPCPLDTQIHLEVTPCQVKDSPRILGKGGGSGWVEKFSATARPPVKGGGWIHDWQVAVRYSPVDPVYPYHCG
ncbi:hypothetical protein G9A89_000263 [Geosiphon pyriformis]|nr:hypothetical protein G9A89_000263 [Geosiphon pyriformis]